MRDSLGGAVNIIIIVVFIVIALGYMAFNVNYTKAFRMKNKIISEYEKANGICPSSSDCYRNIREYSREIGYEPSRNSFHCPDDDNYSMDSSHHLYCYKEVQVKSRSDQDSINDRADGKYYRIVTKINIEIPIIDNIFDLDVFKISGDTKTMYDKK